MKDQRYVFIDGLRGIASMAVVLIHFHTLGIFNPILSRDRVTWLEAILLHGYLGVPIFFVLSGFVMAHSQRHANPSVGYFGRFIVKRSLRLDPAYWLAIGLMIVVGTGATWREIAANVFYVQGFAGQTPILPPAWTLAYEIQFYVSIVLLIMLSRTMSRISLVPETVTLTLSMLMGIVSLVVYANRPEDYGPFFIDRWWMFYLGVLAYWGLNSIRPIWFWLFVDAAMVCSLFFYHGAHCERAVASIIAAVVIFAVGRRGKLTTWLGGPVVQFFGKISYSTYLLHWPVALLVMKMNAPLAQIPIAFAALIGLAWLVYRWVEMPGIELGRWLGRAGRVDSSCRAGHHSHSFCPSTV